MSLMIMFNHCGGESFASPDGLRGIGILSNMRSDWPVSVLIVLGGFSLAASMRKPVDNKIDYFKNKIAALHPTYLLALLLSTANFLVVCRPSNYERFGMSGYPSHADGCAAAPVEMPWGVTLVTSFLTYALGLQAWLWPVAWFLMFYTWFNSVYYFCLLCYPYFHNFMYSRRTPRALWVAMGLVIVGTEMRALGLGLSVLKSVRDIGGGFANAFALSAYLFPPLWVPLFFGGALVAWMYERSNLGHSKSKLPGIACDVLTLLFAARFVIDVVGGIGQPHLEDYWGNAAVPRFFEDDPLRRRTWVAMLSQMYMPLVFVWTWLLAAGRGWTAHVLSNETLVTVFAPAAYNEYLLHQVVGQWYFWASRGRPWSWWSERKAFYWFSPNPLPVSWPETCVVILLSIAVAKWVNKHLDTRLTPLWMRAVNKILGAKASDDLSAEELVSSVLEDITGSDVDLESTLAEAGLVSIGMPVLVSMLNEAHPKVALTLKEVSECATIEDLVDCVAKFLGTNEAGMENEPIGHRLTSASAITRAVGRSASLQSRFSTASARLEEV